MEGRERWGGGSLGGVGWSSPCLCLQGCEALAAVKEKMWKIAEVRGKGKDKMDTKSICK